MPDTLALSQHWGEQAGDRIELAPLIGFNAVLEESWLRRGIRRDAFLRELLTDLHQRRLVPLLAMLPRGWRLAPAALPERLRGLGAVLEEGLINPMLLAALADDLQHLLPSPTHNGGGADAMSRWRARCLETAPGLSQPLPRSLDDWQRLAMLEVQTGTAEGKTKQQIVESTMSVRCLGAGLDWQNHGLQHLQNDRCRAANRLLAQVFNALGANHLPDGSGSPTNDCFIFEGVDRSQALVSLLSARGWSCRARVRASVASFGLGASAPAADGHWRQIPLAVPYRTGLLRHGQEIEALLPHCSLELELQPPEGEDPVLLQYYQGTEGLNGWAAMNDLDRPWQNDRHNGTVAYPAEPFDGERLGQVLNLCDLMAAVHNSIASDGHLRFGGYGALGFCIDSTALLEQAMNGHSTLFPLTLSGLWRERLNHQLEHCLAAGLRPGKGNDGDTVVEQYREALQSLPQDLTVHGADAQKAEARLRGSQPRHSPFLCVRQLNGEDASITTADHNSLQRRRVSSSSRQIADTTLDR